MTRSICCVVGLGAVVIALLPASARSADVRLTAEQLVAKVIAMRKLTGFRIHAQLTRTTIGSGEKDVRQLLIKGLRYRTGTTLLYQQLWPRVAGGRAIVIDASSDRKLRGFVYEADRATPLTPRMLTDRLFGSDLRIEDVAEAFWYWPSPKIAGEEAVGEYGCVIVDFSPPPNTPTTYSLVKTWITPDLGIGLRARLFGRDGRLIKEIGGYRVLKVDDRWRPSIVTIDPADGRSRTVIEGVRYEPRLPLTAADFTVAATKRSVRSAK